MWEYGDARKNGRGCRPHHPPAERLTSRSTRLLNFRHAELSDQAWEPLFPPAAPQAFILQSLPKARFCPTIPPHTIQIMIRVSEFAVARILCSGTCLFFHLLQDLRAFANRHLDDHFLFATLDRQLDFFSWFVLPQFLHHLLKIFGVNLVLCLEVVDS